MADVLCVGMNDAAMIKRKLILEKAGHAVIQARDVRKVTEACEATSFSVVVLGQGFNGSEKMRVSGIVRTCCKTAKILELHSTIVPEFPGADGHLRVTASEPEGLVEAVNALLRVSRKAKPGRLPSRCTFALPAGRHQS